MRQNSVCGQVKKKMFKKSRQDDDDYLNFYSTDFLDDIKPPTHTQKMKDDAHTGNYKEDTKLIPIP